MRVRVKECYYELLVANFLGFFDPDQACTNNWRRASCSHRHITATLVVISL